MKAPLAGEAEASGGNVVGHLGIRLLPASLQGCLQEALQANFCL